MRVEKFPYAPGRNGRSSTPTPKDDEEEASGSGSSGGAVDPRDEHYYEDRHGHGKKEDGGEETSPEDGGKKSKRDELTKMHEEHQSAAVRAWEESLAKSRSAAKLEREKDDGPIGGLKRE